MNVSKLQYNNADKAMRKDSADEAHTHNKQPKKPSADSVGASVIVADSFGSAPEIEYYSNYTKSGVLGDIINAQQAAQAELAAASVEDTVVERFDLRSIPEFVDFASPPNWSMIPHRGMTTLSQEEIRGLVRELADKFNNTTCERERSRLSRQATTLRMWYQSHGSPENRKTLFDQAMRTIRRHAGGNRFDFNHTDRKTLLDHLMGREGFRLGSGGMREGKPYPIPGGGTVTATGVVGMMQGLSFEVKHQGQTAISITTIGSKPSSVNFWPTQHEIQLHDEINDYWFRHISQSNFR